MCRNLLMPAVMVTFWVAFQITAIIFIVVAAAIGQAALEWVFNPHICKHDLQTLHWAIPTLARTKSQLWRWATLLLQWALHWRHKTGAYIIDHQGLLQEIRWEDMGDFGIGVYEVALVQTAEGKSSNTTLNRDRCIYLNGWLSTAR